MTTRAKICYGYNSYHGGWVCEKSFYVNYDGYPENIIPMIKNGNTDKFEELEDFNDFGDVDYIYYVEENRRIRVVAFDWNFFSNFLVDSYKLVEEVSF